VTVSDAEYEVTKALLPFLIEEGTPVNIRRNGWALVVSTSISGPPRERTREFVEKDWLELVNAVTTYTHVTGKLSYSTAVVIPPLGTWWVTIEPCH
jgi:hypothetical protein